MKIVFYIELRRFLILAARRLEDSILVVALFFNISGSPFGRFDFGGVFLSLKNMEYTLPNELWRYILEIKAYTFKINRRCKVCHFPDSKKCTAYRCGRCTNLVCEEGLYNCFLCEDMYCYRHYFYYNDFKDKLLCKSCWEDFDLKDLDLSEVRDSVDLSK